MEEISHLLIVASAFVAIASPGPATLAIAGTSMSHGRYSGLSLAAGEKNRESLFLLHKNKGKEVCH